ncbi:Uncharacterized protein Rs2_17012 [Raphanus sativus]|nr:Uncharacterized protein Rs2_17012 [Raphanus sativus]
MWPISGPRKTCKPKSPQHTYPAPSPKEKPRPKPHRFTDLASHVLKPQPLERRVADTAVSASRTARARRRGRNRITGNTSHPLHFIRRPTLNQSRTEPTGNSGRRTSTTETTSNNKIRGIGFGGFHQRPDLQRDSIGTAEISSKFGHQPPSRNTQLSARAHPWDSEASDQYRQGKRYGPRIKTGDDGSL